VREFVHALAPAGASPNPAMPQALTGTVDYRRQSPLFRPFRGGGGADDFRLGRWERDAEDVCRPAAVCDGVRSGLSTRRDEALLSQVTVPNDADGSAFVFLDTKAVDGCHLTVT